MANSKKEILEWLALKRRTAGWGAVVSYPQSKCNALLLDDYIAKFTTSDYLPPINEVVRTGDTSWESLMDWITDRPRLSFEDSSTRPGGEVNMTMAVVGGIQVSIDNTSGHKRVNALKYLDPLNHPKFIAKNVALSKTVGLVGQHTGEVVLDLGGEEAKAASWQLTFANTEHECKIGGAFFKQYYREADKEKRLYHLGKIAYIDKQYLKPKSFKLRTITANGVASPTANDSGNGAVQLFVCMDGDEEGGTPPSDDWNSLIADKEGADTEDVTVLLDHSLVIKNVIMQNIIKAFRTGMHELKQTVDPVTGFIAVDALPGKGAMSIHQIRGETENYRYMLTGIEITLLLVMILALL
ncbi:hypothetical protein IMF27_04260 [Pseudomonas sp. PCH199]|uniref:hypothetical protein n=1 Tax=unclassified Pseudomonas TaxID=196821 RepID=UPI000BD50D0D|nr:MULTISPECIES: hypothetical protein [unclassified Pseudomonas]MCW8275010.1 hypothetical protein [Pseudomonas sp. PCH199]PAM84687.1 hypothetical protein CES87_04350 [Pseudomonas sp. ERMR1:02]